MRWFMSDSIYRILQWYTARPLPIPRKAKPRRKIPRGFTRSGCSSAYHMELKRHLNELLNLLTPDLRRREFHTGERVLHGGGEPRVAGAEVLEGAPLVSATLVHFQLREHLTLDASGL